LIGKIVGFCQVVQWGIGGNMGHMADISHTQKLHSEIVVQLQTLKRELDRLNIRQSAIERCRLAVLRQNSGLEDEDEDESLEEITSNIDAIKYDLGTFKEQLKERFEHSEQGLRLVFIMGEEKSTISFYQYVLDEVKLCVRDAKVAREGYDELINNVKEITRLRDK